MKRRGRGGLGAASDGGVGAFALLRTMMPVRVSRQT